MKLAKNLILILILLLLQHSMSTAQNFTRIFGQPQVLDGKGSRSVNFVDVNNDSYPDLFISNGKSGGENNMLYINNQDGTFTQVLAGDIVSDGKSSDGASFADINNDGTIDGFVGNWYGQNNLLYKNSDTYSFTLISNQIPSNDAGHTESSSFADIDLDGDLDLFVANSGGTLVNYLYINNGNGIYSKDTLSVITQDADISRCGVWGDYDNDGDPDLFVANETGFPNRLYENLGDGTFVKITTGNIVTDMGNSWGASWGDFDNDLDLDLFVTNNSGERNFLYQNNGDKTFTSISLVNPVIDFTNSVSSSWIDFDNDGDQDLFVANGWGPTNGTNFLYQNDGAGVFTKITGEAIVTSQGWTYGHGWADNDKDGDLDLMLAKWLNETEYNSFFRNDIGSSNNWISIHCIGTKSNISAVGTRVYVYATINGTPTWQMQEISTQHGYCVQNSLDVSIGLQDATIIDSLIIQWTNSERTIMTNVSSNQFLTVYEDGIQIKADKTFGAVPLDVQFDNITGLTVNSYNWNFNDSSTSSDASPLHSFTSPGLYSINLSAQTFDSSYMIHRENYIAVYGDTIFPQTQYGTAGDTIVVPIEIHNYLPLSSLTLPFHWSGDFNATFVSINNAGTDAGFMNYTAVHTDLFNKRLTFKLSSPTDSLLPAGNNIIAEAIFVIPPVAPLGSVEVDLNDYLTYTKKTISPYGSYAPTAVSGFVIHACCVGLRGNIDSDALDMVDISDLVFLVDYMFTAGPTPSCIAEANVDGDAGEVVDISDLVALVDFMFNSGPPPVSCT